jgi:hypothetical protein
MIPSSPKTQPVAVVKPDPEPSSVTIPAPVTPEDKIHSSSYPYTVSEPTKFFIYKPEMESYVEEEGIVTAQIVHRDDDPPFTFHIAIINADGSLRLLHLVSSNMNQRYSQKMLGFTWNYSDGVGGINSFCISFSDEASLSRFVHAFAQAGWETLHQSSFKKVKEEEQAYVMSATTEDVEMADPEDDDEDDEADVLHELDPENGTHGLHQISCDISNTFAEPSDEEEEDEYEDADEDGPEPLRKGEKNSHLTIGYKGDAFVVRGDKIGVFRQREDGTVQYQASIGNVQTPKGKKFKPSKVCT